MIYVIFIYGIVSASGSIAVTSHEFNGKAACESAVKSITAASSSSVRIGAACFPKGDVDGKDIQAPRN